MTCFYEEMPVVGVGLVSRVIIAPSSSANASIQIVPQDSAIIPGYVPIGIHANHMDMTKFAALDDPGFIAVSGELQRWIRSLVPGAASWSVDRR